MKLRVVCSVGLGGYDYHQRVSDPEDLRGVQFQETPAVSGQHLGAAQ